MLDDVTGLQQLDLYPVILTSSSIQHNRLSVKGKKLSIFCNVMKTLWRGSNHASPPQSLFVCHGRIRGAMYVKGLTYKMVPNGTKKADQPSQRMVWENCRAVPNHQLPHVLCGAGT